ncbi:MAG: hypothetical protein SVX43_22265, partial [Cyanobacteriota bacterium]|nr:hypothetical protein [Cyanobacteriota bacterium]
SRMRLAVRRWGGMRSLQRPLAPVFEGSELVLVEAIAADDARNQSNASKGGRVVFDFPLRPIEIEVVTFAKHFVAVIEQLDDGGGERKFFGVGGGKRG